MQERYKYLKEKSMLSKNSRENASNSGICLDKSLSEALSTFDHFFCRRCLVNTKILLSFQNYCHSHYVYSNVHTFFVHLRLITLKNMIDSVE